MSSVSLLGVLVLAKEVGLSSAEHAAVGGFEELAGDREALAIVTQSDCHSCHEIIDYAVNADWSSDETIRHVIVQESGERPSKLGSSWEFIVDPLLAARLGNYVVPTGLRVAANGLILSRTVLGNSDALEKLYGEFQRHSFKIGEKNVD